jgi:5-methylcytosine-specific restriction enzyme subunit McrC
MPTNNIDLFEYSNSVKFTGDIDTLEDFLEFIWNNRDITAYSGDDAELVGERLLSNQRFLAIGRDGTIKSQKYVGIIKFNDTVINLLPKIFYDKKIDVTTEQKDAIHANILWWLSYCRKYKFPKSKSSLKTIKADFFEVLIYLFANYTKEILNRIIVHNFEDVSSELNFIKGRVNFPSYIKENLSTANWQKVSCTYDSFEIDNNLNRIIKYVAKQLRGTTTSFENKSLLSEILFLLEDVSDCNMTIHDCGKVKINPFFDGMNVVFDYCKLFLSNSMSFTYKNELKVFAFLMPMEYIFEDFIYGFMETNLKELDGVSKLASQKRDVYLARLYKGKKLIDDKVFNLQHDIYLEYRNKKVIVDTKYKLTYQTTTDDMQLDNKCGVSQGDLYQVMAYAVRRKADNLLLIYPMNLKHQQTGIDANESPVRFCITDEYSNQDIKVDILNVPIIHQDFPNVQKNQRLHESFKRTEQVLLDTLINRLDML